MKSFSPHWRDHGRSGDSPSVFARDEQAIAEAKTKYGSVCRRIAENILHSREDAEECVNDVWVRTWNSIPPNRPERLLGYLAAITRNLALDRWRRENAACRRGSKPELAMEELGEILANSGNVEAEVEAEELAREISRFVQGLSARKRTIFIRRYFNVESLEQIASDLRTTPNSVSATLSIIRKKLRRYLSERDYL